MKIETKRLIIRPWSLLDVRDMYAYASDSRVSGSTGFLKSDSLTTSLKILNEMILKNESMAIVLKEINVVIGSIGVMKRTSDPNIDANLQREIGYGLNQNYWGHEYMSEVVNAILDYCFNVLGIELVWVCHADFNYNSKRVIEKIGFKYVSSMDLIRGTNIYYHYVMSKSNWRCLQNR